MEFCREDFVATLLSATLKDLSATLKSRENTPCQHTILGGKWMALRYIHWKKKVEPKWLYSGAISMSTGWPPFRYCFGATLQRGTIMSALQSTVCLIVKLRFPKEGPFSQKVPRCSHFGSTFFSAERDSWPSYVSCTVEPWYKDHLWERAKVVSWAKWSLFFQF